MKLFEELQWRGLIKDVAGDDIEEKINNGGMTFYIGTDPTADSMHIGHYSSFLISKRLAKGGHHPILLVGGATGRIGDPRPTSEREMKSIQEIEYNIKGLTKQAEEIFGFEVVNNFDWSKDINFIDFLRDYGKFFSLNYMLDKDIIKRRLETGITYTEFSYMIMQALDFLYLYENKNCTMQVAGSDQWGNITAGVDLIRKKTGKDVYAFTMPLITNKDGVKISKSEGKTLWLDKNKTSSYELYQYFINTDDSLCETFLKVFTFIEPEEIMNIMERHNKEPHLRIAQKIIAEQVITDLHGKEEYEKALKTTEILFSGNIRELDKNDIEKVFNNVDNFEIKEEQNVVDMLVNTTICSSKREAREFLTTGSITINGEKITDLDFNITKEFAIDNKYVVVRRGKKKYYLVKFN